MPACKEMLSGLPERIRELERLLLDLEHQLEQTCSTNDELQRSYVCLKVEYLALERVFFGPRRERLPEAAGQLHLFDDVARRRSPPTNLLLPLLLTKCHRRAPHGAGRRKLSDDLPRRSAARCRPRGSHCCSAAARR